MREALADARPTPPGDPLRRKALVLDCTLEEGLRRAVRRADAALARLTPSFDLWMEAEADRLGEAGAAYLADPAGRETLFRVAHDLRGQAATMGYPLAGRICRSLARLLAAHPAPPAALVAEHVRAVRAIVRQGAKDALDPVGATLAGELERLTESLVSAQDAPRPTAKRKGAPGGAL